MSRAIGSHASTLMAHSIPPSIRARARTGKLLPLCFNPTAALLWRAVSPVLMGPPTMAFAGLTPMGVLIKTSVLGMGTTTLRLLLRYNLMDATLLADKFF